MDYAKFAIKITDEHRPLIEFFGWNYDAILNLDDFKPESYITFSISKSFQQSVARHKIKHVSELDGDEAIAVLPRPSLFPTSGVNYNA